MPWRKGHRSVNGKAATHPVVVEVLPPDELPRVDQHDIDARLEARKAIGKPFQKGNKAGGRKPKLAKLGVTTEDPQYMNTLKKAESYRRKRVSEYLVTFGYVSIGVRALLGSASLQLAVSRHLLELGMKNADTDLIRKASAMANEARQNELAAWELCHREGGAKAKASVNAAPWLTGKDKVRVHVEEANPFEAIDTEQTDADNTEQTKAALELPNSDGDSHDK